MKVWSERNGRADVTVYGFSKVDTFVVALAGVIVLVACILVIGGLS